MKTDCIADSETLATLVSFIIIGRNEGWRLELCLKSTLKAIKECQLNAEIIYVDSNSTDNSIEIVQQFPSVKAFVITDHYNAAIARNIGVKESKGESLIFLDGDMEVSTHFLSLILDACGHLKYAFVSGNFMNYYYNDQGEFLRKDFYRKIYVEKDTIQFTTGGLFAIKRMHWMAVGGMKNKYKKGQDLDLGYRLAKKGIPLLRKKELMAYHHTVDYKDKKRMWRSFKDGSYVFPRAILYRDHWCNIYVLKRVLTSDPTWIVLLFMLIVIVCLKSVWPLLLYGLLTAFAVLFSMRKSGFRGYFSRLVNHILRDLLNLFTLFFFYPSNHIEFHYKQVNGEQK
ncbi:glycosyltransferase family 2 protein [Saccharicrinis fermentans]|uniref:Putative glycosyl transferase n=1 Tax=Saccharicrinis fermentans DSM 9555 = JCM 21142 TaxID=869213 RepID=W7YMN8_9BACT|nr:glycosyltransferase family 2 protein [Saccharicrinis fermentans]GAF03659.1 putative glycosyl transferase [Saccharicrinis fermentans DSM 9555 = JCM 21142]